MDTVQGIVFGSTRVGKTNLINELTEKIELKVSSLPYGVTTDNQNSYCIKNNTEFVFWDTPGLFECDNGSVSNKDACINILSLFKKLDSEVKVSFIIFVFKDAVKEIDLYYFKLFSNVFLNKKIKYIIVMTHQNEYLSQEDPSDERYQIPKSAFNTLGISYDFIPVSFETKDPISYQPIKNIQIQKNRNKSNDSLWRSLSIFFNDGDQNYKLKNNINNGQVVLYQSLAHRFLFYLYNNYIKVFIKLKEISDIIKNNKKKSNNI